MEPPTKLNRKIAHSEIRAYHHQIRQFEDNEDVSESFRAKMQKNFNKYRAQHCQMQRARQRERLRDLHYDEYEIEVFLGQHPTALARPTLRPSERINAQPQH